jgi:hypothetical protein
MTSRSLHRISFIRRLLPLSKVITRDIMASMGCLEDAGTRSLGNGRGVLCAMGNRSVSRLACGDTPPPRRPKVTTGKRNQTENWNRKDALAASRRGAGKESWMPVSDDRASFEQYKRGGPNPDQNDSGQYGGARNYRVHQNAYRAMVCIACNRMHMRHLDQNEKCQQDEANYSRHLENAWLSAAIVAQMWPNSCQRKILIRTCQELILRHWSLQIEFNATVPFDAL